MNEEQFRRGIDEFNNHLFFECHDTLEDLWHETRGHDRLFLQGLIQISVGFYHFLNKNFKGAHSQWTKAQQKLEAYRPHHRALDVETLLLEIPKWRLLAERGLAGDRVEVDESQIPKLLYH
jgi:predicted metal-dependent hydrolase